MQHRLSFLLAAMFLAGALVLAPASATTTCESNGTHTAVSLTGTASGTTVQLSWNAVTDPGFQGYKVVISKSDENPKYPDNGYLYFITNPAQTSATVDATSAYNGGDIGGHLQPGETYHFSITTLYCDGTVPGNSIALTFPGTPVPEQTTATPTPAPAVTATATPVPAQVADPAYRAPVVRGTVDGDHIRLTWNRITDSRLLGYKVVASRVNPAPSYPGDGYLYWITDPDQTFATIDNSAPYHGGDIGTSFMPGVLYSFSVTAVYADGSVAGSVVRMNFPSGHQGGYPEPEVNGTADSGHIHLNWGGTSDGRVLGYRVLISRSNPDPRYYGDHDAILTTGRDQYSATLDTSVSYDHGDFGGRLKPGSYYLRVVTIYPDRVVHGRVIRITVPAAVTPVPTVAADYPVPHLTGTVDGSKIRLSWNVITDSRFQGYKVVISKGNANPKYPDDGYLYYITNRNQHTATVDTSGSYNGGDFGGHLLPGESYYFSITALYSGKKVAGNTILLKCPGSTGTTPTPTPAATPVITETPAPEPTPTPAITPTGTATPVPTVTTVVPTPEITTEPTPSVYDLLEEQNRKIDAQNQLISEQNKKLAEQSGMLDHLLAFLRTLFRF